MLAAGFREKKSFGARLPRLAQSCLALCGMLALTSAALGQNATSQPVPTQPAPATQPHPTQKGKGTPPPTPPPVPTVAPSLFEQPASPATVTADNNELTVKADNSSLAQILHQVSSKTGMQLDGLGGDERVFGSFGPAAPREVLTALLDGTSYNVVMVGDLPSGAPRELLLTRRTGGGASTPADTAQNQNPGQNGQNGQNAQNAQNGDDSTQDDSGNSGDDASDDSPPMQYTPPSIAPAEPVPPTAQNPQNPQNPRVAPPMQNAPE